MMGRRSMALTAALLLLCVSCASSPEHTWDSARVQAVLSADGTAAQAAPRSAEASVYTFPVLTGTTMLDTVHVSFVLVYMDLKCFDTETFFADRGKLLEFLHGG